MKKTSKSLRLTERDVEYTSWIAEQQAVRLDTLRLLFEVKGKKIDPRALRRLVERWQKIGLVQKQIMVVNAPSIIWPTAEGMRVANLPLRRRRNLRCFRGITRYGVGCEGFEPPTR